MGKGNSWTHRRTEPQRVFSFVFIPTDAVQTVPIPPPPAPILLAWKPEEQHLFPLSLCSPHLLPLSLLLSSGPSWTAAAPAPAHGGASSGADAASCSAPLHSPPVLMPAQSSLTPLRLNFKVTTGKKTWHGIFNTLYFDML